MTAIIFFLSGLALSGIPPAGLSSGKTLLEETASSMGYSWLSVFFLLSSILTGGAVLRAGMRVFFGWGVRAEKVEEEARTEKEKRETTGHRGRSAWFFVVPAACLMIFSYLAGSLPGLQEKAFRAAGQFQDRTGYAFAVLDGKSPIPNEEKIESGLPKRSLLSGIAAVIGALILALAALFGYRLPRTVQRVFEFLSAPVQVLRSLQRGHLGDFITWIVVGTAFFGVLFTFLQ